MDSTTRLARAAAAVASAMPSATTTKRSSAKRLDQGVGADGGHDPARRLADQTVAGGVAEGVGHHADALEPDEEDGDVGAVDLGPSEGGAQVGGEEHPVRQLGELVVGGAVLELALDVGVVGDGADEADDLTVVAGRWRRGGSAPSGRSRRRR